MAHGSDGRFLYAPLRFTEKVIIAKDKCRQPTGSSRCRPRAILRLGHFTLFLLTTALVLTVLVACDSSSNQTQLIRYFQQLAVNDSTQQRANALIQQFRDQTSGASDAQVIQLTIEFIGNSAPLMEQVIDAYTLIKPPSVVQSKHTTLLAAFRQYAQALKTTALDLNSARTRADARTIVRAKLVPAAIAATNACLALTDLAKEEGLRVNFVCFANAINFV